ncbi:hypothetical protein LXL04_011191 [Taraxacum kok-saghyz]
MHQRYKMAAVVPQRLVQSYIGRNLSGRLITISHFQIDALLDDYPRYHGYSFIRDQAVIDITMVPTRPTLFTKKSYVINKATSVVAASGIKFHHVLFDILRSSQFPGEPLYTDDPTTPPDSSETTALTVSSSHHILKLTSPTSIRVRIKSTSLNYANYLQVLGKYQEKLVLSFVPGSDYSGVVDFVGPKVTKFKVGDPVCSFAGVSSFAQFVVAEEKDLFGVPDGCDLVAAGALPVAYGTSHMALVHTAKLKAGQQKTSYLKGRYGIRSSFATAFATEIIP